MYVAFNGPVRRCSIVTDELRPDLKNNKNQYIIWICESIQKYQVKIVINLSIFFPHPK